MKQHTIVLSYDELFSILGSEAFRRLHLEPQRFDVRLRVEVRDGLLFAIEVVLMEIS